MIALRAVGPRKECEDGIVGRIGLCLDDLAADAVHGQDGADQLARDQICRGRAKKP